MELPVKLQQEIVNFLMSLPNIHDNDGQRALILQAGLDIELQAQIQFNKPLILFIPFLVSILLNYGYLKDGRSAIEAVLEATKYFVGEDKKEYCDMLLQQTNVFIKRQSLQSSEQTKAIITPPSLPKIYHNLPQPDYGQFIGREQELEKIKQILRPYPHSQYPIVTIDGIGGIGKTSLALEIAHQYLRSYDDLKSEEQFDAIIWTSAKQTVLSAEGILSRRQILRSLDGIYNAVATALQREDIIRTAPKEQERLVRHVLTLQRTLIIVDNLETIDDEAVIEFLRELPAPTKAIVTTRHRLDVAYPVRLAGMTPEDSQRLIQQECEKKCVDLNHENIQHLYKRTGGVPLAIVWSVAQMGFGHGIEAILTRLGQPTSDIARFCFEGALERIKERAPHKLLMALSLGKEGASRETLGYATGLPELDRDDGLVELEKLSLANKQGTRFNLLPLTKQFALSELQKSSNREQLQRKWIEYFQDQSKQNTGEYWNWKDYDWLLSEGENLLSAVDLAVDIGHKEVALGLVCGIMRYLDIKGRWSELITYGEQLYTIAQELDQRRTLAWISAHWLAFFYVELGELTRAEALAKQSQSLYHDLHDPKGECLALNYLGRVYRRAGKYKEAEEVFERAMDLATKYNYGDGKAYIHFEWGKMNREQGEWESAYKQYEAAVEWCEQHEEADLDISFLMATRGNLGWVEFQIGTSRQDMKLILHGKEAIERSVEFFEKMGGMGNTATLRIRLAEIEEYLGNKTKSVEYAKEALFWANRLSMERESQEARRLLESA